MKKSLENFAREVAAVASEWAVDMPLNLVERVTRQVEHFDIAVIGHYNAGKSTLLNTVLALPENDCLPVGPLPTTRLPWKLVFGSDRMIRGYRENGSEAFSSGLDEINSPEFAALCEGYDDMTFIQASIESQMLALPGLAIWDTPGMNDPSGLYDHERLRLLLPLIDVVIFVCTDEQHGDFLDELARLREEGIRRFLVILTNAENRELEEFLADRHRQVEEVRAVLTSALGEDVDFVAIESDLAGEAISGLRRIGREFNDALTGFLDCSRPEALTHHAWTDELGRLLHNLGRSGVVGVRRALGQLLASGEVIVAERALGSIDDTMRQLRELVARWRAEADCEAREIGSKRAKLEICLATRPAVPRVANCARKLRAIAGASYKTARNQCIEDVRNSLAEAHQAAVKIGWWRKLIDFVHNERRARFLEHFTPAVELARDAFKRRLESALSEALDQAVCGLHVEAWSDYCRETGYTITNSTPASDRTVSSTLDRFIDAEVEAILPAINVGDFESDDGAQREFVTLVSKAIGRTWRRAIVELAGVARKLIAASFDAAERGAVTGWNEQNAALGLRERQQYERIGEIEQCAERLTVLGSVRAQLLARVASNSRTT